MDRYFNLHLWPNLKAMKYLYIVLIVSVLASCKKDTCYNCTVNWKYRNYQHYGTGNFDYGPWQQGAPETFTDCSENKDGQTLTKQEPISGTTWREGEGKCSCTEK